MKVLLLLFTHPFFGLKSLIFRRVQRNNKNAPCSPVFDMKLFFIFLQNNFDVRIKVFNLAAQTNTTLIHKLCKQ